MRILFTRVISLLFFCVIANFSFAQTVENFTTPGSFSWVCPAGVTSLQVQSWGAGGAGGGNTSGGTAQRAGGGGGGGSYVTNTITVVPGVTYNITVGAGGVWSGTVTNFLSYGPLGGKSEFSGGAVTTLTASGGTGGGGGNTASLSGSGGVLGGLYGFTVSAAGINYTTGTTTIDLTGGGGSGATTAFVVASGGINTIATLNQGSGYTSAPTVTINSNNTPTAGSGAAATALVNLNLNAGGTPTTGANGVAGVAGASGSGGAGGNGAGPGGGVGGASNAAGATGGPGLAGAAPGGGGSGGFQGSSNTNSRYGGAGGAGKVTLTYAASATNYYYKGTGALSDVANWGLNTNGTGTAPANFTNDLQYFNIRNTAAVSTTAQWLVTAITSKIIIGDPTLPAVALTIAPGMYIKGNVEIPAASGGSNAVTVSDTVPNFGIMHPSSQVHLHGKITIDNPFTFGNLLVDGVADTITFTASPITIKTSLVTAAGSLVIGNANNVNYVDVSGAAVTINGIFRTARTAGISSANITPAGNAAYGLFQFSGADNITLGASSIIEYIKSSSVNAQTITPRSNYANVTFWGPDNNKQFTGSTTITGTFTNNMSGTSTVTGFNQVTFANNATIVRAEDAGAQDAAPTFGASVNVSYTGTTAQITSYEIPSAAGVLNNLTITNPAGVTLTSAASVKGVLALTSGAAATLSAALNIMGGPTPGSLSVAGGATLNTGGFLTLKSDANGTAMVASSAGTISGNATVERFIPALGRRAWRLLGAHVNAATAPTINSSWQEAGAAAATGSHITKAGGAATNGYDGVASSTGGASIYYWNGSSLVSPSNTDATKITDNGGAYFLFVRGNRMLDINTAGVNGNTTLRQTGTLNQGNVTTGVAGTSFSLIPNPYASPVDYESIFATNAFSTYYVWDANLAGVGGYRTIIRTGAETYSSTPSTANNNSMRYIRSGQAFFVNGNTTFNFTEAMKTNMLPVTNVYRTGAGTEEITIDLRVMDGSANGVLYDGIRVRYNNSFSALVDGNDAPKLNNFNENLAIFSNNINLAVEQRPLADAGDTLSLKLWNTGIKNYRFDINPSNFSATANLDAYLIDNFLSTTTPVSLSANTMYDFSVTSNSASAAANRFMIVYKASTPLPVNFTHVKAFTKNTGIQVEWNVAAEKDVVNYEVEKSNNGTSFDKAMTIQASNSKAYNWFDASPENGNNYYRIKVINKDNSNSYSDVVMVKIGKVIADMVSVYPNPVKGSVINVQLNNLEKGTYTLQLVNNIGQQVFSKAISTDGGSMSQVFSTNKLAGGIYTLVLKGNNGVISSQKIVKE